MAKVNVSPMRTSGTHTWCHLTGEESAITYFARRLGKTINRDRRGVHLDLTKHERELAIRYGAAEADQDELKPGV
jgi:hypothetical protein